MVAARIFTPAFIICDSFLRFFSISVNTFYDLCTVKYDVMLNIFCHEKMLLAFSFVFKGF